MSDQNPSQPTDAGDDSEQTSAAGYPPPSGSGSIYESSAYGQPPPEPPPEPTPQPVSGSAAVPPPVAGSPPPGYEGTYPPGAYAQQQGPYAQQPHAYPAPAGQKNNTQLFGILGIVFAVVCCPLLGILFGWLSMNEARKTGSDETLGKIGFWLGIAFTAVAVVSVIIAACAGAFGSWNTN